MLDNIIDPKIGEVYLMQFHGSDSEQRGVRPGIIFQNNLGNKHSPNVIALPLTTHLKKINQPTHVLLESKNNSGLKYDSIALCENPSTVSKNNINKYLFTLSKDDMKKVTVAHLIATSELSFLDFDTLCNVYYSSVSINECRS